MHVHISFIFACLELDRLGDAIIGGFGFSFPSALPVFLPSGFPSFRPPFLPSALPSVRPPFLPSVRLPSLSMPKHAKEAKESKN